MKTLEKDKVEAKPQLQTIVQKKPAIFDLIIIGGGPGGLTAALYAGRARLKTLLIERAIIGGMASTTFHIDNYPGFPDGISGSDLSIKMEEGIKKLDVQVMYGDVSKINQDRSIEINGQNIKAKAIIIATGTENKKLGVDGENALRGRGVSYCATCDGPFYRDKSIAVVGGGNSAVEEALYLTRFANKVTIIHRRDSLRSDKIITEKAMNNPKIFIMWNAVIEKIVGEKNVEKIYLKNIQTNEATQIPMDGVFIYIGSVANTKLVKDFLQLTESGYIVADKEMKTSVPGIFACGDVIDKSLRQVITAAGDGAIAAESARKFIEEQKEIV